MPLLPPPPPDFPPPIERLILRPGPAFNVSLSDDFGFLFFCLGSPRTHSPPCPADISSGFHTHIRRRPDACLALTFLRLRLLRRHVAIIADRASTADAFSTKRDLGECASRLLFRRRLVAIIADSSARAANALSEQQNLRGVANRLRARSGRCRTIATSTRRQRDWQRQRQNRLRAIAALTGTRRRARRHALASVTKISQRGLKILCTCSPGYVLGRRTNCRLAATDMCHQEQMRWGSHRRSDTRQRDRQAYALGPIGGPAQMRPGTCAGTQVVGGSFFGSLMLAQDCDAGPTK